MNGQFQIGQLTPWRYFLAIGIAVGLVLGFTAPTPDESFSLTLMIQWQIQSLSAVGILVISQIYLAKLTPYRAANPWIQLIISGVTASVIIAPLFLMVDILSGLNVTPTGANQWSVALFEELVGFLPPVLVTWLAINAPFCLGYRLVPDERLPESKDSVPTNQPLNFTDKTISDILYLKAELHYIKVVTTEGSDLVLYNLKDAAAELPGPSGAFCHRSYWVNYSGIQKFEKLGRQGTLLLVNGESIPVSRQHVSKFTALN